MLNDRHAGRKNDGRGDGLHARAGAALQQAVKAGVKAYDRRRDLPGLIRVMPNSGDSETTADIEEIVARLERALRAERSRARAGHWTYDLNRHIALHQAQLAESQRLSASKSKRR